MSGKNKKQFGVWLDSNHATIVGREQVDTGDFVILAEAKNDGQGSNSNENTANNAQQGLQQKFFKEITAHIQNAEEVHITGTGVSQEQFIHFMAETAQFKNTVANESTSNKMGDKKLIEYIAGKFN
jgi:stalled ribosome rescue protein Dom34